MKRVGWISLSLALVLVLVGAGQRYLGSGEPADIVLIILPIFLVAGLFALAASAMIRLARGELKLRLWDALKKGLVLFAIILSFRCLAWLAFPDLERNFGYELFQSAMFAAAFALYTTAYRKPA